MSETPLEEAERYVLEMKDRIVRQREIVLEMLSYGQAQAHADALTILEQMNVTLGMMYAHLADERQRQSI